MELGIVALTVVAVIIGVGIGVFIERSKAKKIEAQGVIYAYYGDRDTKPSLLLEYNASIDDIASRKRVLLDVVKIR